MSFGERALSFLWAWGGRSCECACKLWTSTRNGLGLELVVCFDIFDTSLLVLWLYFLNIFPAFLSLCVCTCLLACMRVCVHSDLELWTIGNLLDLVTGLAVWTMFSLFGLWLVALLVDGQAIE